MGWGGAVNVLSITSLILRCQHICSLEDATCYCVDTTLGWGGAVNVLLTTSLILRCQHICSLEDATCYCVDTTLRWGGDGGGVGWGCQRPVDYVLDTTLSAYMFS